MTEILPFRGIIYETDMVSGDDVISPPYDIISPEMKDGLYSKSTYNIVRIDFGKDLPGDGENENRYTRASSYLKEWLAGGILKEADRPAFYLCEVSYGIEGEKRVMRGIFARVRITELCEGIYPHEATHSKPKADRLNLMRHCNANISPIFSIYNRPGHSYGEIFERTVRKEAYIKAYDLDRAMHRMWMIDDPADISVIQEQLRGVPIYIADGHHRYETALTYRNERRRSNPSHSGDEPYNFVLMYLVNMSDGGLTILPTHRLVKELPSIPEKGGGRGLQILDPLKRYFEVRTVQDAGGIVTELRKHSHAIGLAVHGGKEGYILIFKGGDLSDLPGPLREIDVTVLHELILKRLYNIDTVSYEMNAGKTLERVNSGEYRAAFFLNPTRVEEVERVALACLRMPPKSTYFYPKILTGLVLNRLD